MGINLIYIIPKSVLDNPMTHHGSGGRGVQIWESRASTSKKQTNKQKKSQTTGLASEKDSAF